MRTKTKISILSALMVLSMFAMAVMPASASPGATTASEGDSTNPGPTNSTVVSTEGGEITEVNLTADSYTERWAGFYGNVTGHISLGDGTDDLYQWTWTAADEGEVIASTSYSINWTTLTSGAALDVNTQWDFTGGSDLANDTYDDNSGSFTIGDESTSSTPVADTLGGYQTGIIKDNETVTSKDNFLFVVNIDNDGTTFNGVHDFEMIVPTDNSADDATEDYYFYVELF